ncbi:MAG: type IV pilus biogenesis/stability protein PilW [Polyangiaceae bacterium]
MVTRNFRIVLALSAGLASSAIAQTSHADGAADAAAAQSLFDEGKALLAQGKTESACQKLQASQRLDPAPGTQFHLAACYEKLGRTASAWALYLEVAAAAKSKGRADAEKAARERAEALAGALAKLSIDVPDSSKLPGLVVKRDGAEVSETLYGNAVAVDPGKHVIEASAPGHQYFRKEINVSNKEEAAFSLPKLQVEASTQGTATANDSPGPSADASVESHDSTLMPWPYISLGVGLVGVGLGGFFVLRSSSKRSEADDLFDACGSDCQATDPRSAQIADLDDQARSSQTIGTIGFVVGGLGIAGAVTLFLMDPKPERQARARVTPWVGPGGAGLFGRF